MAPCPRWIKMDGAPIDLPNSVPESRLAEMPEGVGEMYEECGGQVKCTYSYDPGCYRTSNGDGWPPSEDFECEDCDCCGASDWSEAEEEVFLEYERNAGNDDGPDEDDRDDPRYDR